MGFPLGIYSQGEREGDQVRNTLQENKPQYDKGNTRSQLWSFYLNKPQEVNNLSNFSYTTKTLFGVINGEGPLTNVLPTSGVKAEHMQSIDISSL